LRTFRRSVIVAWSVSYLIVLFVPIVFSTWVYTETVKTLQHSIERANDSLLQQMQETVDNQVDSFKRLTAQIYADVKVQNLLYSNIFARGNFQYEIYQVAQDLKLFRSAYSTYDDFYLYWAADDSVIRPSTYMSGDMAYQDLHAGGNLSLEQWRSKLRGVNSRQFLLTTFQSESGGLKEYLTFVSSFPADHNNQPSGSTVIMIDTKQMLTVISRIREFSDGAAMILNNEGDILVSSGERSSSLPEFKKFAGAAGYVESSYNGELSRYYYIRSQNSDLTYVSIVPDRLVRKEANHVRRLMYYGIAFSLMGGISLTYLFMRRNYKPIRRMLSMLDIGTNRSGGEAGNEFAWIEQSLSQTLEENDRISTRIQQQHKQLRSSFISRLLKGRIENETEASLDEVLQSFQMGSQKDSFCVLLIYVENSALFRERTGNMEPAKQEKLLRFIITNVFEEMVGRDFQSCMTEADDMMACLINLGSEPGTEVMQQLLHTAEEGLAFLENKYSIDVTVAIGGIHTSIDGIAEAYREAHSSMEYKFVLESREVILYDRLSRDRLLQENHDYYFPLHVERQLLNYLQVGDAQKARVTLDEIVERNFNGSALNIELAKCLMFDLVGTFIKSMIESGDTKDVFLTRHQQTIEQLTKAGTVKEMRTLLHAMLEEVCQQTAARQEVNKQKFRDQELENLIQAVKKYIEIHCADPNLNVSLIGDAFQMKATYLSKLFRDATGEGALDYIGRIRIEKAKLLLRNNNATLEEAANQCGFQSLNTFIRIFKKVEGITPGQYKRMM